MILLKGPFTQRRAQGPRPSRGKVDRIAPSIISHSRSQRTYEREKRLRLPALLLPIIERHEIIALARVFVDGEGRKHPKLDEPKRTLGDPRGGAVRIGRLDGDHLDLAEGFEEAESVVAMFGLPGCWSVNGAELYARVQIPDHIRSITIYSQHGEAAASGLAKAEPHLAAGGRRIKVRLPPPGGDWNDAWRAT